VISPPQTVSKPNGGLRAAFFSLVGMRTLRRFVGDRLPGWLSTVLWMHKSEAG